VSDVLVVLALVVLLAVAFGHPRGRVEAAAGVLRPTRLARTDAPA
jgi:hypothetical protein